MEIFNIPVFNLDGGGNEGISKDVDLLFNRTVCLVEDFNYDLTKAIGSAHLQKIGNKVYAHMWFVDSDYDFADLYPTVGMTFLRNITDFKTLKTTITEAEITTVSLSKRKNIDETIKRIGEL